MKLLYKEMAFHYSNIPEEIRLDLSGFQLWQLHYKCVCSNNNDPVHHRLPGSHTLTLQFYWRGSPAVCLCVCVCSDTVHVVHSLRFRSTALLQKTVKCEKAINKHTSVTSPFSALLVLFTDNAEECEGVYAECSSVTTHHHIFTHTHTHLQTMFHLL